MDIQQVVKQSLPASRTTLDKLGPSFTRMIRISTVICYASCDTRPTVGKELQIGRFVLEIDGDGPVFAGRFGCCPHVSPLCHQVW
jgi:hypothetical protein